MEDTGRIRELLAPRARRIVFGRTADAAVDAELRLSTEIDRAHLVMAAERGLLALGRVRPLLREIERLRAEDFQPLRSRSAPRGLYILYEDYLIETLGDEIGGSLHIGRSRNDLNATLLRLRLREPFRSLIRQLLGLQAVLLRRALRFGDVVMPVHTHYQPALPVTYGHYAAGVALALGRDIEGLLQAAGGLDSCPLGAGAAGGTSVPIDSTRVSSLLGFADPALHSVDAVAARDVVLRLLGGASIAGITLSRLATDMLLWSSPEFGFLSFPDRLVGSSSMMPQKRNPFLLEHVQGRSTAPLGAFVASASAMHAKPYTNSISVGSEAVAPVWNALTALREAATLARLMVAGAIPDAEAMRHAASRGYVSATELANRLGLHGGMAFRSAHKAVGGIVRRAIEGGGEPLEKAAERALGSAAAAVPTQGLDPESVVQATRYGGGPAAESLETCVAAVRRRWARDVRELRARCTRWQAAARSLDEAVADVLETGPPG